MKKFLIAMTAAAILFAPSGKVFADVPVPEDIFKWVLSTARGNYFFNQQQAGYYVRPDDTIDLNILIVPTICTYDEVQIQDVVQKRRWNMLSTTGYGDLVGRADYLKFNLELGTVQVTERVDLDHTFTALDTDKSGSPVALSSLSENDINCKFYRAILSWAKENHDMLVARSRGRLKESDKKMKPEKLPIARIPLPGVKKAITE